MEADIPEEEVISEGITIYGFTKSIHLLVVFVVAFLGMSFVFFEALASGSYPTPITAMFGSLWGLTLFAVIFGTARYFAEQVITFVCANMLVMMGVEESEPDERAGAGDTLHNKDNQKD